ncbi:MAG TPA: hypothetical protein VK760_01570 [Candidatus Acidoferrales bacterium]|nr:hypothetical protein [Candidatus Acidoferrales bacterium]
MTDSPYVLAGIVIIIVAIVGGIAVTIIRSRSENSYSIPQSARAYEPNDEPNEPADLSKLDALMATPSAVVDEPIEGLEPVEDLEPAQPVPAQVEVEVPQRLEDDPLPDLWARLVATEDGPLPVQDRLDMVARLEMVGEKWCIDALQSAAHEEQDPHVNAAVHATLARLHA